MIYESRDGIGEYLLNCRNFEECILVDIRWKHFGTVFEFDFDYTWSDDGSVRREYEPSDIRTLILQNVQEVHICNALTEYMTLHPQELTWGLSEVSSVRVVDDEKLLAKYQMLAIPLHHIRCNWEGERKIDVVFSTLEVGTDRGVA